MAINDEAAKSTRNAFGRIDDLILAVDNPAKLKKLQDDALGRKLALAFMEGMLEPAHDKPMSGLAAQIADQDEELHNLEAGECCGNGCPIHDDELDLSHETCEDEEIL